MGTTSSEKSIIFSLGRYCINDLTDQVIFLGQYCFQPIKKYFLKLEMA